jgi:hypothetical protein
MNHRERLEGIRAALAGKILISPQFSMCTISTLNAPECLTWEVNVSPV